VKPLIVLENTRRWPLDLPEAEVVPARSYLVDPRYSGLRDVHVFNLCRSYRYQSVGYYVSLLAAARGHRPMPSVATMQDLRLSPLLRIVGGDLDSHIQRALAPLRSDRFELSIYFGRNLARRYDRLGRALFNQYPAPLLRATFERDGRWMLTRIRPIATSEIPEGHRDFVLRQARQHFRRREWSRRAARGYRYELAILRDPTELDSPSDELALRRFERAARQEGLEPTFIDKDDYGRIAEFDALFIRETTFVNHHTFRFARRAAAEGLVVIDDPNSILRCTNKVYQAELFARQGITCPRTLVIQEADAERIVREVGLPCVLKRPDSSFSLGVKKASTLEELEAILATLFDTTELAIAQEFLSTEFDWRVGVLDGEPLWVCKYFMAPRHWQIVGRYEGGSRRFGKVEPMAVESAPRAAVQLARRCARHVGDGLYGVDLKEVGGRFHVMEINDNPNIDAGCEDRVLGIGLYRRIMRTFRERLDRRVAPRDGRG
jgi:glutathione synthase/RimK-type ligase-like ATP-grasp enzyme